MDTEVITLVGRLTDDAQPFTTPNGKRGLRFSVACNDRNKKGHFWSCAYFMTNIDALQPYMLKGKQVNVIGRISWNTSKDGREFMNVDVMTIQCLGSRSDTEVSTPTEARTNRSDWADFDRCADEAFGKTPAKTEEGPEAFGDGDDLPW